MNQQCLDCGNYAEGKVIMTLPRKLTRSVFQEGGAKVVGGVFTLFLGSGAIGVIAAGILANTLFGDKVEEMASFVESFVFHETEYEFTCPFCGHKWTKKEISQDSLKSFVEAYITATGDNRFKFALLESLKESISNKASNESCLNFLSGASNKLQKNIKSVYDKHLDGHNVKSYKHVFEEKEILSKGRNLLGKIRNNFNSK
ncbi:MAG: hypothetical protein E7085_02175 [Parabacteroides distasonis]|nr:hypothetical protein [Parabacteroides distasonis]